MKHFECFRKNMPGFEKAEIMQTAALCVREGISPRNLDVKKLQAALRKEGVEI